MGSGCGKFYSVTALTSSGQITGVEQRPELVDIAKKAAGELNIENVVFIHNNMTELDWAYFDGFYLFNPFYEHQVKSISNGCLPFVQSG